MPGRTGNRSVAEFRIIRSDRIVRWISARGKFDYGRCDAERMLGMAVDITARKQGRRASPA